ncbi:MAG: hypothetical protein Q9190_007584 [Brigantiaea leucoxantha]
MSFSRGWGCSGRGLEEGMQKWPSRYQILASAFRVISLGTVKALQMVGETGNCLGLLQLPSPLYLHPSTFKGSLEILLKIATSKMDHLQPIWTSIQPLKRKQTAEDAPTLQQKRRKQDHNVEDMAEENTNPPLSFSLIWQHIIQRARRFGADPSLLEAENKHMLGMDNKPYFTQSIRICRAKGYIEDAFADTSEWGMLHTMENLPLFMDYFIRDSSQHKRFLQQRKMIGVPHTLVVTSAGYRAADLGGMGVGIGTASRLLHLVRANLLKLDQLERIVVDSSFIDEKQRRVFSTEESETPLL